MLTLQQILESDSIATLVAKLNQNFQTVALSNGGPQGIRGNQGIPGLPGKQGPIGPTGEQGPEGTVVGIIPFANVPGVGSTAGPTIDNSPAYGVVGPWPQSSWQWLMYYHSNGISGGSGETPNPNDVFIDHANNGYWKWLTDIDNPGSYDPAATPPYTQGGAYSFAGSTTYPDLGSSLGWVGTGWYFYPVSSSSTANLSTVWTQDHTSYLVSNYAGLSGPYAKGPYYEESSSPLSIANARLITKYGTVWITSGNDASDSATDNNYDTSTIGKWGEGPGSTVSQPARNNAGIDRLLFKMSLDGLPFFSNITARGFIGANNDPNMIFPSSDYPTTSGTPTQMSGANYWVKPQYGVSLDKFSPLLFLSHRDDTLGGSDASYGSLGIYLFTDNSNINTLLPSQPNNPWGSDTTLPNDNAAKTIHLFSSRYAEDPLIMFPGAQIQSNTTQNYGEQVLDFRRTIASNQYVCSLPVDMKLSSDGVTGTGISGVNYVNTVDENNRYRTYQGYISAINGKALTGDPSSADFWEYGLGSGSTYGPTGGTHDTASGTAGMYTRKTWYGTSVLTTLPSAWEGTAPGLNDYIQVAGMMERGRRTIEGTKTNFLSELIFYTSSFTKSTSSLINGVAVTNDITSPSYNLHRSWPAMYVSPFQNIGVGTFLRPPSYDISVSYEPNGPFEPSGRLHVHVHDILATDNRTKIKTTLASGTGQYAKLPTTSFNAAVFTSMNENVSAGNLDMLFGRLNSRTYEYVNPGTSGVNAGTNILLKNAVRSEAWLTSPVYGNYSLSTLRLGAQPGGFTEYIGKSNVKAYQNEFQFAIHPLTLTTSDITSPLLTISGVGIHNMYPRARAHFFGKNTYNEVLYGQQPWTPGWTIKSLGSTGSSLTGTFPYYGQTASNSPSANQVIIDYIGDSYAYPVGLYEYGYFANTLSGGGATGGINNVYSLSTNSAVYPNRDSITPTRHAVPYGGFTYSNFAYPGNPFWDPFIVFNGAYKHGGTANAWWNPSSFVGFNMYRDLSAARDNYNNNQLGDNRDMTRWLIGTQGVNDGSNHANNGAAAIISSNQGELGIITVPRGRDGGRAYEQWEQRGLGTRDVLNLMKIVFDKNGNIAVGNGAGWDLDAYPSLERNLSTGKLNYVPLTGALTNSPTTASANSAYTYARWSGATGRYGQVSYSALVGPETSSSSPAAQVNKNASSPEYIRLEVAAEKAWSRDGRLLQKRGFGYPPSRTLTISGSLVSRYVLSTFLPDDGSVTSLVLVTDAEGRITNSTLTWSAFSFVGPYPQPAASYFTIVYPHPSEFDGGSSPLLAEGPLHGLIAGTEFIAGPGAMAAEWWAMSTDAPAYTGNLLGTITPITSGGNTIAYTMTPVFTTDTRGSANIRLNNFVYGEGYGFTGLQNASGATADPNSSTYTQSVIRNKRQESPKLILSFLEATPSAAEIASRGYGVTEPYKKVNTVIASAQNEASIREYWIPKTDNTGGTLMSFTDHLGKKEKDSGFDKTSIKVTTTATQAAGTTAGTPGATAASGLHLDTVVTQEFLAGYTGGEAYSTISTGEYFNYPYLDGYPVYAKAYTGNTSLPAPPLVGVVAKNMFPGYVRYYNRDYSAPGQQSTAFPPNVVANIVQVAPDVGITATNLVGDTALPDYSEFGLSNINQIAIPANTGAVQFAQNFPTFTVSSSSLAYNTDGNYTRHLMTLHNDSRRKFSFIDDSNGHLVTVTVRCVSGSNVLIDVQGDFFPAIGSPINDGDNLITSSVVTAVDRADRTITISNPASGDGYTLANCYEVYTVGSVCEYARDTYIDFIPNRNPIKRRPNGVRIEIEIACNVVLPAGRYWDDGDGNSVGYSSLAIGLRGVQATGGDSNIYVTSFNELTALGYSPVMSDDITCGSVNVTKGMDAEINEQSRNGRINTTIVLNISYDTWVRADIGAWRLCMMLPYGSGGTSPRRGYVNIGAITGTDPTVTVSRLRMKFEHTYDNTIPTMVEQTIPSTYSLTEATRATIERNIDYFYSIYNPNVGDPDYPGVDNKVSAVRFKRINSEFVLVDFNVTVKVDNPRITGKYNGVPDVPGTNPYNVSNWTNSVINGSFIDFCSPRYTQYLRFTYVPDEADGLTRQDETLDTYGNALNFKNWSSFNQWYSGSAVTTDATQYGFSQRYTNTTNQPIGSNIKRPSDFGPFFNDYVPNYTEGTGVPGIYGVRTWNGNFLEMLAKVNDASQRYGQEDPIYRSNTIKTNLSSMNTKTLIDPSTGKYIVNPDQQSGIYAAFGSDRRMLNIAAKVFNKWSQYYVNNIYTDTIFGACLDEDQVKQIGFANYLGSMYSLWGNSSFMRNKNMQWRITPNYAYRYNPDETRSGQDTRNNTFTLEVQFSDPILHTDVALGAGAFSVSTDNNSGNTRKPYQYLTLSGQAIIKYEVTNNPWAGEYISGNYSAVPSPYVPPEYNPGDFQGGGHSPGGGDFGNPGDLGGGGFDPFG